MVGFGVIFCGGVFWVECWSGFLGVFDNFSSGGVCCDLLYVWYANNPPFLFFHCNHRT